MLAQLSAHVDLGPPAPVGQVPDRRDAVAVHGHVGLERRTASAVVYRAMAQDDVVFGRDLGGIHHVGGEHEREDEQGHGIASLFGSCDRAAAELKV